MAGPHPHRQSLHLAMKAGMEGGDTPECRGMSTARSKLEPYLAAITATSPTHPNLHTDPMPFPYLPSKHLPPPRTPTPQPPPPAISTSKSSIDPCPKSPYPPDPHSTPSPQPGRICPSRSQTNTTGVYGRSIQPQKHLLGCMTRLSFRRGGGTDGTMAGEARQDRSAREGRASRPYIRTNKSPGDPISIIPKTPPNPDNPYPPTPPSRKPALLPIGYKRNYKYTKRSMQRKKSWKMSGTSRKWKRYISSSRLCSVRPRCS